MWGSLMVAIQSPLKEQRQILRTRHQYGIERAPQFRDHGSGEGRGKIPVIIRLHGAGQAITSVKVISSPSSPTRSR